MIPYIKHVFRDFFYDEKAASRLFRGFLLWFGGMAMAVLAYPIELVQTWGVRDWSYRLAAAGALGFAGMISAGQKNQTPEQIRDELAALPPKDPP